MKCYEDAIQENYLFFYCAYTTLKEKLNISKQKKGKTFF